MKTISSLFLTVLALAGTTGNLQSQDNNLCSHEKQTTPNYITQAPDFSDDNNPELEQFSAHLQFDRNTITYQLPKDCTLASLLILNATGEVAALCPIDVEKVRCIGTAELLTNELPAGRYYIKLLVDYAVLDTKQFIKLQ